MYESFYGINCRPFLADPDPDCCAGVGTMQQAYNELYNCFEQGKGIGILTGSAGTGKTLLCLKLLDDLSDLLRGVFLAGANYSNRRSLLQAILYELDHPYRGLDEQELRVELITAAKNAKRANRSILLVVDEAHLLNETLLEEIRSATNLIENGESLVRVLLSGQIPLEETMTRPALDALNQRVGCHQSLETLTRQQSIDYIEFRFKRAGTNVFDVFAAESVQLITEAADGNPRCLNQLCDHALFLGFADEEKPIETTTVRAALEDLKQLPLHWNDLLSTTDEYDQSAPESMSDDSISDDSISDESFSDESFSDDSDIDNSLIEDASAESPATIDVETSTEESEVFEIGALEETEAAEAENCFELDASEGFELEALEETELDASEETDQFAEIESEARETSMESAQVADVAALESDVEENVSIQVSSLETWIQSLEIDTTNIGVTVHQSLDDESIGNQSTLIQPIVVQSIDQSMETYSAVCIDDPDEQENESTESLESLDEVVVGQKEKILTGSFKEEPVEDLYARLDAEKERVFSQSSHATPTPWEQTSDELVSTSFTQQEEFDQEDGVPISPPVLRDSPDPVWYSSDSENSVVSGPEQIIDQVVPLLNEAAELPVEEMPSETSQQDREISETISTEGEEETEETNVIDDAIYSDEPSQDLFVSNDQTGSTEFDTSLEAHQADIPQLHQLEENHSKNEPEPTSKVLFSDGERLQLPVQFDVVQPERRERFLRDEMVVHEPSLPLKSDSGQSNNPESATKKQPKYDQLFSELRKRRLA